MERSSNLIKIGLVFSLFFLIFTLIIKSYQLIGLTDYGFWLTAYKNFIHSGVFNTSVTDGHAFWSSSLILVFTPIFYFFKDPIIDVYLLNYFTYLLWFMVSYLVLFNGFNLKKTVFYFIIFFSSVTVLFHYNLNYNGWESVFLAVPFTIMSYYYLFIKSNYKKSILWFFPLLFLKVEFFLVLIFLNLAFYIGERNKKYLYGALTSVMIFVIYLKVLSPLLTSSSEGSLLMGRYGHLLHIESLASFIFDISFIKRVMLILLFFFPFLSFIDLKKIESKSLLQFLMILTPTIGYCILSSHIAMSYWSIEHYSLPILGLVFIFIVKYGVFSKERIIVFIAVNMFLASIIIYNKQPWQYKYYQDEKQLKERVFPLLILDTKTKIVADDRSGIYFTNSQVNYLNYIKVTKPKYIVINTRYTYSSANLKYKVVKVIKSSEYIRNLHITQNYKLIYKNYPFVILEKKFGSIFSVDSVDLNIWDKKTIESNRWI